MARRASSFVIVDEEKFRASIVAVGFADVADARKALIAGDNKSRYRVVSVRSGIQTIHVGETRKLEEAEE